MNQNVGHLDTEETGNLPPIVFVFGAIALFLIVFMLRTGVGGDENDDDEPPTTSAGEMPPGYVAVGAKTYYIPPAARPRTSQTFDIPDGGHRVWLGQGPKFYPKGGPVRVTTPSGSTFISVPGVDRKHGYEPDGYYVLHAEPTGSVRGMEINNRW